MIPATVWFTGLSGSGKSTIAQALADLLKERDVRFVVIDGDEFRKVISPDLAYSLEDREMNMQRVAQVCKVINDHGSFAIAAVMSPTKSSRDFARNCVPQIIEVYTKCSLDVLEKRDVKNHYKNFREGKMKHLIGKDLRYDEPDNPDLILETDKLTVEECARRIMEKLQPYLSSFSL